MEGITNETCTASRIYPPEHPYLENTIPSMEAAFQYGADIVELDVHITADGKFAVFHDWTVDCRTNGHGVTREHTLAELKKLDIGYGYTADGGKTYPFRGKGMGLLPSLHEVLERFPDKPFLIHVPEKYAPLLWGWPHRFMRRMDAVNTRVILVAGSGKFSEGFDSAGDLERIPENYTGGIWTNRVDRIGPLLHN